MQVQVEMNKNKANNNTT